jgi:hypothetical protein
VQESSDRGEAALGAGFAVLPLAIDWAYKAVVHPRPFWAFYYDPEAIYFYDGLRLLRGETPVNVDNPATLVQLLSAAILAPLRRSPFAVDAFRNAAYVVALALSALGVFVLMRTVLRDAPILLRLAAVWSYLSFPAVLEYNTVWSPDMLYLAVGSVGLAAAWAYFRRRSTRRAALFGAAIGFCVALKFTFLVWIVAMLLAIALLRAWSEMAAAVAGCVAGFVVTTLPVVNRYPDMARFLAKLFLHRGAYGNAPEASLPGAPEIARGVARFVTAFWPWHLWTAAFLIAALVVLVMRGRSIATERRSELVFILAAFVLPYVAAARQISPRYVIPSGLAAVALIGIAATTFRWPRALQYTAFGAIAFVLATTWRGNIAAHDARIVNATRLQAAVRWVIGTRGVADPVIVYSWRFPSPSYALRVLAPEDDFLREIERSFPREGDYNPFWRKLRLPAGSTGWDFFVIAPEDLAASPAAGAVRVAQVGNYLVMRGR